MHRRLRLAAAALAAAAIAATANAATAIGVFIAATHAATRAPSPPPLLPPPRRRPGGPQVDEVPYLVATRRVGGARPCIAVPRMSVCLVCV